MGVKLIFPSIPLKEASYPGLNANDYSDATLYNNPLKDENGVDIVTPIWDYLQNKEYDKALQEASQEDKIKVVTKWLFDNAPNIIQLDDIDSLEMVLEWVNAYKTFDVNRNPFTSYLVGANKKGIKTTYDDLLTINNKYANGILINDDLREQSMANILASKSFYVDKTSDDEQEYWVDTYALLSDLNSYRDIIKRLEPIRKFKLGNEEYDVINFASSDYNAQFKFRDLVLFNDGDPSKSLRPKKVIEEFFDGLKEDKPQRTNATKKKVNWKEVVSKLVDEDRKALIQALRDTK